VGWIKRPLSLSLKSHEIHQIRDGDREEMMEMLLLCKTLDDL